MLSITALLLALSGDAEARPGHAAHHGRVVVAPRGHVRFTIGLNPWSPAYVPAPRVGFRWVAGFYVRGAWTPGYWVPTSPAPEPGLTWVPGHWEGSRYVDGYWRKQARQGQAWVEGHYDAGGNWVEGSWVDQRDANAYRSGPSAGQPAPPPSTPPTTPPTRARRAPPVEEAPPPEPYAEPSYADPPPPAGEGMAIPVEMEEEDPDGSVHAPPPSR